MNQWTGIWKYWQPPIVSLSLVTFVSESTKYHITNIDDAFMNVNGIHVKMQKQIGLKTYILTYWTT